MRKRVLKIASVVLVMSALAGIIARVNSVSLALALGGYKGNIPGIPGLLGPAKGR